MADKNLKSITFPGLPDKYIIPQVDDTLAITGRPADSKATGDALATKVDKVTGKGLSENDYTTAEKTKLAGIEDGATNVTIDSTLTQTGKAADAKAVGDAIGAIDVDTVNNARQLLSENYLLDEEPYLFRASGGDGADRVEECIVGGTVGWNQLCNGSSVTVTSGHKYVSKVSTTWTVGASTGSAITGLTSGSDMIIDLTTLFGPTIADYIYSLEQSTAGAGVAWFRKYFPEDYYEYCAPTLKHVEGVSAKQVVGFNQWDEEWEVGEYHIDSGVKTGSAGVRSKNPIRIIGGAQYRLYAKTAAASNNIGFCFYDADSNYISGGVSSQTFGNVIVTAPQNARYLNFFAPNSWYGSTYNHDICISLSDPTKNGKYEAYHKNIYPLDSTWTGMGIPKLDNNNRLYFDGDIYPPSGQVERRYGTRAYAEGDATDGSTMITDGTTTVYKLTTPTTETATPYTALQTLDPHGTEEFVSTGIVPVGHYSKYPENLRAKIEGLPKDFSTLIAPTEAMYKATRNYTVGSLLIVDNILYKVTSAIANGGTITPNTNVTATTLAAVIAALA